MVEMSTFSETVYRNKYAHEGENWEDTARRVVETVVKPYFPEDVEELTQIVIARKFIPGGRYLYATGKPFHQTQNCLLLTVEDSRESISDLFNRVSSGLMTGAGIGIVWSNLRENGAPVKGMGGKSTGPVAFMKAVNEIGRNIMQGGSRRSAIWAGLHWNHPDIFEFMSVKDWPQEIVDMKAKDFNAVAPMDMTNISIILDDDFFTAYNDSAHPDNELARVVYKNAVEKMLTTGEPGFSVDIGKNAGEHLRNAPVTAETQILTDYGYETVGSIVDLPVTIWTGKQWAKNVVFKKTMENADIVKVSMTGGRVIRCEPTHEFLVERYKGAGARRKLVSIERVPARDLKPTDILHVSMPESHTRERLSYDSTIKVMSVEFDGVEDVYCADVHVPEHSFMAEGVIISNCTEITSRDDNDICNLGSINMARINSVEEMGRVVELATRFLLCGTLYSKVPYEGVAKTREKNRRLGLGLMGVHEWLALRGKPYAPDTELQKYLEVYQGSHAIAGHAADLLGVSRPIAATSVAPAGTIAIVAETTSGAEPAYALAFKRRYLKGTEWHFQYVVENLAKRLHTQGVDPDTIDTAFSLAKTPERRLAFQAWLQQYVDQGISSTVNLPSKEEQSFTSEEFGTILMKYLPKLRGVTVYPDGARGGQPLTVVPYAEAVDWEGYEYAEFSNENSCQGGVCGI